MGTSSFPIFSILLSLSLIACSDELSSDSGGSGIASDGGEATADGGTATDGGGTTSDGGASDGGSPDGGTSDGGASDGGTSDGGVSDGGTSGEVGSDGGTSDGGVSDGGVSDGGVSDGGTSGEVGSDGGTSDGGVSDGGVSDGGVSDGGTTDGGTSSDGGATPAEPDPAEMTSTFFLNRVMVRVDDGVDLAEVAADYGSLVVRDVGPAGFGVLDVPSGDDLNDHLVALRTDDRVEESSRMGLISGAAWDGRGGAYVDQQWHLSMLDMPDVGDLPDASGVVVAVLDTGVAYTDTTDGGVTHVQAPGFASTTFVSPYDFVNDDDHPGDDHQHGTHIASLIAAGGDVEGVATGVQIMPVKVLDADNSGWEVHLLDGLRHAIDNGADVINLSLSFGLDYLPSPGLLELLAEAEEAGIIVVGAAGNSGAAGVSWPAAAPSVIAVGASTRGSDSDYISRLEMADYSNHGTRLDVLAPGGDLTLDVDLDGVPDGLLAETISPGDPSTVGYWLMAGTSQAAALVSGAAALYLAEGNDPDDFAGAVSLGAEDKVGYADITYADGFGAGSVRVDETLDKATDDALERTGRFGVALLPYIEVKNDGRVRGAARLTLVSDGSSVIDEPVTLYGSVVGDEAGTWSCLLDGTTTCEVTSSKVWPTDSAGDPVSLGWTFTVDVAAVEGVLHRPVAAVVSSDLLGDVADATSDAPTALGFSWEAEDHDELGDIAEAWSVVALGTGLASSPMGSAFTRDRLTAHATTSDLTFDLSSGESGTMTLVDLDGSGLASSPMGSFTSRLGLLSGSGFASSPMGLVYRLQLPQSDDAVIVLRDGTVSSGSLSDAESDWLGQGGGVNADGYTAPELFWRSGLLDGASVDGSVSTGSSEEWTP